MLRKQAVAVFAAGALVLPIAGYGSDGDSSSNSTAQANPTTTTAADTKPEAEPAAKKGVSIKVQNSDFGRMIFSGGGQAIYLFTKEKGKTPRCYGTCSKAWPPVLTRGEPRARSGVQQSKLDPVKRRDGKTQVTYGGHPLYYYADDPVNKVLCQDVSEFGGTWYVVAPSGKAIA